METVCTYVSRIMLFDLQPRRFTREDSFSIQMYVNVVTPTYVPIWKEPPNLVLHDVISFLAQNRNEDVSRAWCIQWTSCGTARAVMGGRASKFRPQE